MWSGFALAGEEPAAPVAEEPADSPAQAADPQAEAKKQAEERFKRGLALARTSSWDAALAEFLASAELFPTRVALKNAAQCLEQLRRYAEAMDSLQQLLDTFGDSLPSEERMATADAIERLRQNTGSIVITSSAPGASIVVDGRERGVAPLKGPIVVDAGTHVVRVFKQGYSAHDATVVVAAKQEKQVKASLEALESAGELRVSEASGKALDVVVDGVVVGKTPWKGSLSVGKHTVFLRGAEDMGTPPSSASVVANQLTSLSLEAARLDARLRVEPTPSSARVDIDGVPVGNGVWEGKLKAGSHRIEVAEEGFLAYRQDKTIKRGAAEVMRVRLERDPTNPMWKASVFQPHPYAELFVGGAWSPSFRGSADTACSRGDCSDRTRPWGLMGGARGGYQVTSGLGVEVFFAYLRLHEKTTRTQRATGEAGLTLQSDDYQDETTLSGMAFGASASYQFLEETPLLFRIWAGVMRGNASFSNSGTFSGNAAFGTPPTNQDFEVDLSIPEETKQMWIPLFGPEVRFGYRFSKQFSMDLGVAFLIAFAANTTRTGRTAVSRGDRAIVIPEVNGNSRLGLAHLPEEHGFTTFFTFLPTLGGRFDF